MTSAEQWIRRLGLQKHPEGGYFKETYRAAESLATSSLPGRYGSDRALSTSIYFLITAGEPSHFHRVASDELWHFHTGSPLTLHVIDPAGHYRAEHLGVNADAESAPQVAIPHGHWFGATVDQSDGFSLVGCTVAPGFDFADFELADRNILLNLCPEQKTLIYSLTRGL